MAHLFETVLGRLGSRSSLHFKPHESLHISPCGFDLNKDIPLNIAVSLGDITRQLPYQHKENLFELTEQRLLPTGLELQGFDHREGIRVSYKFTAPYYPQHPEISHTPIFILEVEYEVKKVLPEPIIGEISIQIEGFTVEKNILRGKLNQDWSPNKQIENSLFAFETISNSEVAVECLSIVPQTQGDRIAVPYKFDHTHRIATATFAIAVYAPGPLIEAEKRIYHLKYTHDYASLDEMLAVIEKNWRIWLNKSHQFNKLFSESTLTPNQQNLISFGFQSYLANTFWGINEDNAEWWSVWEGRCYYHSTVDVEYSLAWFYLLFEPKFLKMSIDEWSTRVRNRIMAHDMGEWLKANDMAYPHEMPVEENTNYVILTHAYSKITGDTEPLRKRYDIMKTLTEYVLDADTNFNGYPNIGTANTIDDASPAVQYSHQQTYLAIKALAMYTIMAPLADDRSDALFANRCREAIEAINKTLENQAWINDHYVVCLDRVAEGVIDAWTGKPVTGELKGWDAYSLYTTNGLAYLLATDTDVNLNWERIKTDVVNASKNGLSEYGNYHSSADFSNLWISQNLIRDFSASYLGLDLISRADGYMSFEIWENTAGRKGFFIDTYGWNNLNKYPRGATAFGWLLANGGIKIDRIRKRLTLNPPRVPCRIPLVALADWKNDRIPWIDFRLGNGRVFAKIENAGHLTDWTIECPIEVRKQ